MAYAHTKVITIDHTKCGTADVASYVLLFTGTYDGTGGIPDLRRDINGGDSQTVGGTDIVFTSDAAGTTLLNFERVNWDPVTGYCEFRVQLPSGLSYTVDTVIYLQYGDPTKTTDQQTTATWDSNYTAVYHIWEYLLGTQAPGKDSTGNANTLGGNNVSTPGKWGGLALADPSVNGAITNSGAAINNPPSAGGPIHIHGWFKLDSTGNKVCCLVTLGTYPSAHGFAVYAYKDATYSLIYLYGGASPQTDAFFLWSHDTDWHRVDVVAVDSDITHCLVYIDGNALSYDSHGSGGTISLASNTIAIGDSNSNTQKFDGTIDEVMISKINRGTSYITAGFNNENDPASFYSISDYVPTVDNKFLVNPSALDDLIRHINEVKVVSY